MNKFKIGERVRAEVPMSAGSYYKDGTIEVIKDNGLYVKYDSGECLWTHYRQCKRLVKKKPFYIYVAMSDIGCLKMCDGTQGTFVRTHIKMPLDTPRNFYRFKLTRNKQA